MKCITKLKDVETVNSSVDHSPVFLKRLESLEHNIALHAVTVCCVVYSWYAPYPVSICKRHYLHLSVKDVKQMPTSGLLSGHFDGLSFYC